MSTCELENGLCVCVTPFIDKYIYQFYIPNTHIVHTCSLAEICHTIIHRYWLKTVPQQLDHGKIHQRKA
jgi:hypothetical protein